MGAADDRIGEASVEALLDAAAAATSKAFLSREGATRYGAAVLSRSGRIFTAGQYSSFNHITNIHAEEGAILAATMAGEADILALALAVSAPVDARPCGICRQFMLEHAQRTGRDFEFISRADGGGVMRCRVSDLLPGPWAPMGVGGMGPPGAAVRETLRAGTLVPPAGAATGLTRTGEHAVLADGSVAIVWDPSLSENLVLAKIKYAPDGGGKYRKLEHSFADPHRYEEELVRLGWARPLPFGGVACVLHRSEMGRILPLKGTGDFHADALAEIEGALRQAGVGAGRVLVSGSRAIGLQGQRSDWDLVIRATPQEVARVRAVMLDRVRDGGWECPADSGTWSVLDRAFPGGRAAVISQGRFLETLSLGGVRFALMFVPLSEAVPCLDASWWPTGRAEMAGVVSEAASAAYKRAYFRLRGAGGTEFEVVSYHKLANLVREGDRVVVTGWGMQKGDARRLVQISSQADRVIWQTGARP